MKVLVLSCNTGEGHNSAGKAIAEQFEKKKIYCEMQDTLSFASDKVSRHVCSIYVKATLKTPRLFGLCYHAGEAIGSSKRKSPVYFANTEYAKALGEYINKNHFDTVIAPHLFPAEALTYLRRKRQVDAALYAVSTDYSCCPLFEETDMDYYFIPHQKLRREFIERGIPAEKLVVTGIPVLESFIGKTDKDTARRALGLPDGKRFVLFMTGSMGFGRIENTVSLLLETTGPNVCAVVLAGNNQALKATLSKRFAGNERVVVVDFTKRVPLYMDACDVLFTKPGGLSTTEAAVKNIPIIHTAPIPGCETTNAEFSHKMGISAFGGNAKTSVDAAVRLCGNHRLAEQMTQAQREQINPFSARDICDFVVSKAQNG